MNIKNMRTQTNMTQKEFGEYFNIPVRTLQDWEAGRRTPPVYVVELIKYKTEKERLGMYKLTVADHGERKTLVEGTVSGIVQYLQDNPEVYDWVRDEDPEMELPELESVDSLRELQYELSKVDLDWWRLDIEEA